MNLYAAVDIGGTEIKFGVLEESGAIVEKTARKTPSDGGPGILREVLEQIARYREQYPLCGVPISSAGVVDCDRAVITYAGETIPNFIGTDFRKAVEDRFGLPCEAENDVNCAGLAEYVSGAGRGSRNMVCLTVGTGVGGCAIVDGTVLHGSGNSAMEIGYLSVDGTDFQQTASTAALCRKVAAQKGDPPEQWNGKQVFSAAAQGDLLCLKAIDELCEALGKGIAAICYVLNPDTVVLGGGIMRDHALLEPGLDRALRAHLRPMVYDVLRLRFASYGNDAGLIGALYHFLGRQSKESSHR